MRAPRSTFTFLTCASVTIAALVLLADQSSAASSASTATTAQWCTNTAEVVLTTCGSACPEDQACAQYPSKATQQCSNAARNNCEVHDTTCAFQCLKVYNPIVGKWTLFVKEPKASDMFANKPNDSFPAAPIQSVAGFQLPPDAKDIQITGFDNIDVQKGSTKDLKLDNDIFENAAALQSLALSNIDLSKLATNFLPSSVSTLLIENCKLSDVPADVSNMPNIRTLNISKNTIAELPSADSKMVKTLQSLTTLNLRANGLSTFNWVLPALTTLDLGGNKLTAFPTSIFNMTKLISLNLDGNAIASPSFTASQVSFLKRLSAGSSLGVDVAASASTTCASGQRKDVVLGATVCVVDSESTTTPTKPTTDNSTDGSSSSNTLLIVCIAVAAAVVVGGVGFFCYRRRSKANSAFYESVMENNNHHQHQSNTNGTTTTNNNTNGTNNGGNNNTNGTNGNTPSRGSFFNRGRAASGGRRSSMQVNGNNNGNNGNAGGRPSRAGSNASRPSKPSASSYSEIGKYQEQLQQQQQYNSGASSSSTLAMALAGGSVSGSRQRQRAQINQNVVRIASDDINYTRTIAKGAHGEVWLAHLGRDLIAVKKLITNDPASVGEFVGELNLLASLQHPRILSLVGACWADDMSDIQIVLEYMDSGDLLTVLRRRSAQELTWEKGKAAYCLQVCEAVYYLHSLQPALIHRDIKSRNILVDERKGAKLSDFGESRERTIQNTMTAGVGTARWVAPEIILGEDYSELADIYSLGVLLTELDTHKIPFEDLKLEEHMIVQQVAVGKLRPKVSDSCPDVIRRLAHECLQFDPQLRPTAARVLQTLMASPLVRRLSTISDSELE